MEIDQEATSAALYASTSSYRLLPSRGSWDSDVVDFTVMTDAGPLVFTLVRLDPASAVRSFYATATTPAGRDLHRKYPHVFHVEPDDLDHYAFALCLMFLEEIATQDGRWAQGALCTSVRAFDVSGESS